MKRFVFAGMAAAGMIALGSGFASSAQAAVAGPQPAMVGDVPVTKTAMVCGPFGCRWVPGPYYYGPRYYGPAYYGPPRVFSRPRPYGWSYGYRSYYGPRW